MLVSFDPNSWYKLTNHYCGADTPLDIVNDAGKDSSGALKMAAWGPHGHSGQYWRFRPHEDNDGTFKLCTMFLGTKKCLDVYVDDKTRPHLADAGKCPSQKWRIVPWLRDGRWDGTYKLWNLYGGKDLVLDTYAGSKRPYMGEGSHSGKHWNIEAIEPVSQEEHWIH